jgi:hypothetical protein
VKRLLYPFVIILFFLLSACQQAAFSADKLPWISEEKVLFRDDFSYPTGGWETYQDSLRLAGYQSGEFRLWLNVSHFQTWSVLGLNFSDVQVHSRARKLGGSDDNLFGVICRYWDPANYYAFVISSDGYYGIYKMMSGELSLIDQQHMDFSEIIHRGGGENTLFALCQGDQLAFFVNERLLIQVEDTAFQNGDVGLIVGNFSEPGVDILFDDFIVVKP